jgi:esterase/lipase superfamily enzyme
MPGAVEPGVRFRQDTCEGEEAAAGPVARIWIDGVWPMLGRLLFALGLLAFPAPWAQAQPVAGNRVPDLCRVTTNETLPQLQARRERLERAIAAKGGPDAPAGPRQELRKLQEELLEVVAWLECAREAQPEVAVAARRRGVAVRALEPPSADVVQVTTYYATNRNPLQGREPAKAYGTELGTTLHYGRAVVTIPRTHTPGLIETPTLWKLEREPDPSRHFVLKSVTPLAGDAARREMAEKLRGLDSKSILIYVHGFNASFKDAALRTAQLAHDLKFPGMPFFFSWPSASLIRAYWQDEEAARFSESVFERLLDELSQLPATDIYIIAHSMGNRVVGHALQTRVEKGKDTSRLRELLLAAPDINADLFNKIIAPKLAAMKGTRTTVYASSSDVALRISKVVHGFRRLGETTDGISIYPGLETIDASSAASMAKAYGHLYITDSPSVLRDIETVIRKKLSAAQRGLSQIGTSPNQYWQLK